jgi:hypothetical protein
MEGVSCNLQYLIYLYSLPCYGLLQLSAAISHLKSTRRLSVFPILVDLFREYKDYIGIFSEVEENFEHL